MFRLILPMISLLLAAPAADTVTLRYGLRPETPYRQTFDLSFSLRMDAEGTDPDTGESARQTLKNLEQTRAVTVSVITGSEGENGTPVEWSLSEVTGATMTDGRAVPAAGLEKLAGLKLGQGRMLLDRTAVEGDIAAAEAAGHIPGLKERLLQMMPVLPEQPLAIGATFEVPAGLEVPGPPGQGQWRVESNMIYTLERLTEAEAVFDVKQEISMTSGGEAGGEPSMTLSGSSDGSATFDRREGLFSSVEMQTTVEMVLRRMAPRPSGEGGVATIPIRIVSTVKGPIRYRMERVEDGEPDQSR